MRKHLFTFISVIPLTGCIGIGVLYPSDRQEIQNPDLGTRVGFYSEHRTSNTSSFATSRVLTCRQVLEQWGPPDEDSTKGEERQLIYKHNLVFSGLMPVVLVPIPLVLPVGRQYTVVTCQGESIVRAAGNKTVISGAACGLGLFIQGGNAKDSLACTAVSE